MKSNRMFLVLLMVLLLAGFNTACQRQEDKVQAAREEGMAPADHDKVLTASEREMATKIEQGHLGELDLARLAKERASDGDVKDFADMLVDDHSEALENIADILKDKHATDASAQEKPAEAQAALAQMQQLSGAAFDRAFIDTMVTNHRKTLDALHNDVAMAQNPDLKDYINDLTKKVEKHLDEAQELQSKLMSGKK